MESAPGSERPVRLVLLEDHVMVREAIHGHLVAHLGDIDVVYEGDDVPAAVASIAEQGGADIAIIDLDLGQSVSAVDTVLTLVGTGAPVLVVSALGDPALVRSCLNAGALGFVSKHAEMRHVMQAVDATLRRESFTSPEVMSALVMDGGGSVDLSDQERRAATLYASGMTMVAVAEAMGISAFTAQEYIKRVRRKYDAAGRPSRTKTELYKEFRRDGLLP